MTTTQTADAATPIYEPIHEDAVVHGSLVGCDSNAFGILGRYQELARRQGVPRELVARVRDRAMAGDYNRLLAVISAHIDETPDEDDE